MANIARQKYTKDARDNIYDKRHISVDIVPLKQYDDDDDEEEEERQAMRRTAISLAPWLRSALMSAPKFNRWTVAETQERSQERSLTKFSFRVQRSSIARP